MNKWRRNLAGLLLWAALVAPATGDAVTAGDDGGTRSVFATGAGNRALALGGAYCGIADDASALLWNPAGLGLVPQRRLEITQTSLLGFGFSEQYASLVLPSWRWGAIGVTWRRFGVTGIEGRDDRGFLFADDLRDSESELSIGHGRQLLDGDLALGGSLKLRRQELAGYSDGAVGLDLGVWGRPLALLGWTAGASRSLAAGLAVRNALEPEIKLREETVPDPIALRAGLAWTQVLSPRLVVLAAADIERTRGMDGRLHTGFECRLLDLLALRVGRSDGRLTAGAGIAWHGLSADYQFEDHVLESIHRFGVSLAFGPTVGERRRRAHAAAEAAAQARLEAAFAAGNREREQRLTAAIRVHLAQGRWDEALLALGTLEVLTPDHDDRAAMTAAAWSGLARSQETRGDLTAAAVSWRRALTALPDDQTATRELARVQAEADRRASRGREIRQRWEQALDATADDDLVAAAAGFAAILQLSPGDADAARMLEHTSRTLAAREAAARLVATAPAAPRAAVTTAPPRPAVADPRPTPPPTAPPVETISPQRRREIDDLYRRGLDAMQAGRRDEALRYWELVWAADPAHAAVREDLTREYLALGLEAFADGALRAAVTNWEHAVRIDPDDPRARGYLERARQQLGRMEQISSGR